MEKSIEKFGLDINKVSLSELLFNKTMILAYILLGIGVVGIFDIFHLRFFGGFANAYDPIMHPGSREVAEALKESIFGEGGEVVKESPWGLFVANYMFMLYTGSAMILLVALSEVFKLHIIEKMAVPLTAFGLAMVLGGMFTIALDWGNPLNLYWMFLEAHPKSGMWMMLPLYMIYIPFTIIEIYFMIVKDREKSRKMAGVLVFIGILIEFAEFYIQSNLFALNGARHLWSFDATQPIYLVLTGFTAATGVMAIFATINLSGKSSYDEMMEFIRKTALVSIVILGLYELYASFSMPKEYEDLFLNGIFQNWFIWGYVVIGTAVPFLLLLKKSNGLTLLAGLFLLFGAYINRYMFVAGGNAMPMTDRAGTGVQADRIYTFVTQYNYVSPHMSEVAVAIGSFGVALLVYKLADVLFSFTKDRSH